MNSIHRARVLPRPCLVRTSCARKGSSRLIRPVRVRVAASRSSTGTEAAPRGITSRIRCTLTRYKGIPRPRIPLLLLSSGTHNFWTFEFSEKFFFADSRGFDDEFRCSTTVTGELTKSDRAVSGIFGFGQQSLSVISQLASQGVTPKVFSHCLRGDTHGGGILVLGEIVEPNIVFSPLVPSQYVYKIRVGFSFPH